MVKKTNKKTEELEGGGNYVMDQKFPGYEVYFDIESYLNQSDKIKLLFYNKTKDENKYYEGTIQLLKRYTFSQRPIFKDIKPKDLIDFFERINRKGIELPVTDPENINELMTLPEIYQYYNLYMSVDIDSMSTDRTNYDKNIKIHQKLNEHLNEPEIFNYPPFYIYKIFYNKTKHGNKYIYFMGNPDLKKINDILEYLNKNNIKDHVNNIKDQIKLNVPQVQSPQQSPSPQSLQPPPQVQGGKNSQYIMTKQGKRKIHVGKRGGKYYIMNKKKVYVK